MAEHKTHSKPKASSEFAQRELDKAEKQFEAFDKEVKEMTFDKLNAAPKFEEEPQTRMSNREMQSAKEIHLKPKRSLPPGINPKTGESEKFNEKFRKDYEFMKQEVQFIAEHKEIIGETITEMWTKPFPGMECESWDVPVGKPIWGPRYVAEQIKRKGYNVLTMENKPISSDPNGTYYGALTVSSRRQRLDAYPVSDRKSIFMGANNF